MQKIYLLLFTGCMFAALVLHGQDRNADLASIAEKDYSSERITYYAYNEKNNSAPLKFHSSNFLVQVNPINLFFKGLMMVYQKVLSPQISAACLYETTCSNFSKQAIHEFGLFKGIFLSADRLLRCNRASAKDIPARDIDSVSGKALDPLSKYRLHFE